ncbi:uncharacterized protein LOC112168117 isoform X2 [Rosa chinensis]|uniref:uncharacterized protein LOC112168117 isoform X2 n=1 Tax=Rosa chinensis TaxID=74649 RepID=UPI001AD8F1D7|nr:uncharacterized protein LOC112168117 isoform X2 [Rosa chinensis]
MSFTLQVDTREGLAAISSRITETYAMCGACLMIFPTAWLANPSSYVFQRKLVYGNSSPSLVSIKFVILISCFLPALGFFAYSAKQFKETLYLIGSNDERANEAGAIRAFIRGTTFFSLGIRCLLCAGPSLLWFFGPIPMFVSSVALVMISLHVAGNRASPQLHVPPENTDESHGDNSNVTKEEACGHPSIDIEMPPPGV